MKIEFIIPTYNRPDHLMVILNCLMAQTCDDWTAHVIADNPPEGTLDKVKRYFEDNDRIRFTHLQKRWNDWGHTPRNLGLSELREEWVVMTGEDNYYVPTFVAEVLRLATPPVNFIYCDMIHNWTKGQYYHVKCSPQQNEIDIGNSVYRSKLAKLMRLDARQIAADGIFCEAYLRRFGGEQRHINKPLYVHN